MDFRHEWKFPVNEADLIVLRPRLRAILSPDVHAQGGCYTIRSLYFDTPNDDALPDAPDAPGGQGGQGGGSPTLSRQLIEPSAVNATK